VEIDTVKEHIHAVLQKASDEVNELYALIKARHTVIVDVGPDTLIALGKAMGALDEAKALVGRDIDDAR
jgi:hypothetical protein